MAAIELLTKKIWYRSLARIKRLFSVGALTGVSTQSSPVTELPLEIVEAIIGHLIYDTRSLCACSLTCRSWYIASTPHLHYTLLILNTPWPIPKRLKWPTPLRNASKSGLLPLVKRLRVARFVPAESGYKFPPKPFNHRILRQFSGLKNVQELEIFDLDIPSLMPKVQQSFGHFIPTVRSLSLGSPKGSSRQIIFFIGLFQHLEDLTIYGVRAQESEPIGDPTLIPPFSPPLRGKLVMMHLWRAGFLRDMIGLFGGIKFHYMVLYNVNEPQLLLSACAGTLETLELNLAGPLGEQSRYKPLQYLANGLAAQSPPSHLNLSQNKSLRTFEVTASSIGCKIGLSNWTPEPMTGFLRTVLSTITSPIFSEVVVVFRDFNFTGITPRPLPAQSIPRGLTPAEEADEALFHSRVFTVFREMHSTAQDFRLVLRADVWDCVGEYATGVLRQAVAVEKAAKRLDYLPSEPLVILRPQGTPARWDYVSPHSTGRFIFVLP